MKDIDLLKEALTLPFLKPKHIAILFNCGQTRASELSQEIKAEVEADDKVIWCGNMPRDYVEKKLIEYTNVTFTQLKSDLERMGYIPVHNN